MMEEVDYREAGLEVHSLALFPSESLFSVQGKDVSSPPQARARNYSGHVGSYSTKHEPE